MGTILKWIGGIWVLIQVGPFVFSLATYILVWAGDGLCWMIEHRPRVKVEFSRQEVASSARVDRREEGMESSSAPSVSIHPVRPARPASQPTRQSCEGLPFGEKAECRREQFQEANPPGRG